MKKEKIIILFTLVMLLFGNIICHAEGNDAVYSKAKILEALSVINYSGGYETEPVTRGSFIEIIGNILWSGWNLSPEQSFADVKSNHIYAADISEAKRRGLIDGTENDMFYPDRNITLDEAVKITVSAMGYGVKIDKSKDIFDQTRSIATSLGLYKDISAINSAELTNADVVNLIFNSLDAPIVISDI